MREATQLCLLLAFLPQPLSEREGEAPRPRREAGKARQGQHARSAAAGRLGAARPSQPPPLRSGRQRGAAAAKMAQGRAGPKGVPGITRWTFSPESGWGELAEVTPAAGLGGAGEGVGVSAWGRWGHHHPCAWVGGGRCRGVGWLGARCVLVGWGGTAEPGCCVGHDPGAPHACSPAGGGCARDTALSWVLQLNGGVVLLLREAGAGTEPTQPLPRGQGAARTQAWASLTQAGGFTALSSRDMLIGLHF